MRGIVHHPVPRLSTRTGALRKIGAVQEGVLRRSFLRHGQYHDQVLWGILAEDWRLQRVCLQPALVVH